MHYDPTDHPALNPTPRQIAEDRQYDEAVAGLIDATEDLFRGPFRLEVVGAGYPGVCEQARDYVTDGVNCAVEAQREAIGDAIDAHMNECAPEDWSFTTTTWRLLADCEDYWRRVVRTEDGNTREIY